MYAGGGPHALRQPCIDVLRLIGEHPAEFVTDAEVLQELLHIYKARQQWPAGRVVFDGFAFLMRGRVEPLMVSDVQGASTFADTYPRLSARDLVHLAVMRRQGVTRVVTADKGFDGIPGIERLDPTRLDEWHQTVFA
jgi:uncharacterized protein